MSLRLNFSCERRQSRPQWQGTPLTPPPPPWRTPEWRSSPGASTILWHFHPLLLQQAWDWRLCAHLWWFCLDRRHLGAPEANPPWRSHREKGENSVGIFRKRLLLFFSILSSISDFSSSLLTSINSVSSRWKTMSGSATCTTLPWRWPTGQGRIKTHRNATLSKRPISKVKIFNELKKM